MVSEKCSSLIIQLQNSLYTVDRLTSASSHALNVAEKSFGGHISCSAVNLDLFSNGNDYFWFSTFWVSTETLRARGDDSEPAGITSSTRNK